MGGPANIRRRESQHNSAVAASVADCDPAVVALDQLVERCIAREFGGASQSIALDALAALEKLVVHYEHEESPCER
jgi:hypothetical protein